MTKTEYDDYCARFAKGMEGLKYFAVISDEPHFSWRGCEICSSHLGGDR